MTRLEILLIFVFLLYYFCYVRSLEKELNKCHSRKKIDLSQTSSFNNHPDEPSSRSAKVVAIIFAIITWLIILISLLSFFFKLF